MKIKEPINYISHLRKKREKVNVKALCAAYTLLSIYAFIMSIVCFFTFDIKMCIVNAVIAVCFLVSVVFFTKMKSEKFTAINVIIFISIVMTFFIVDGGANGFSVIWTLFVPIAGMYFLSIYYGGILSVLVGVIITIYMLTPLHGIGYEYTTSYSIRFPIVYWACLIVSLFIFERIDKFEEEQAKLILKAEESNRSKSDFLANMSHEIRTPMNAIMGMCELTMNEELSETVRENNENIYTSGKNLMNIINDLLDFSKIESGKMELICAEYSLSALVNDVVNMAIARRGGKSIEFIVDFDPNIPDLLYGDDVRIRQIIINLLTNAIKYTRKGGFLLSISYREEYYGINLIISVKDSGIGIKKEALGKIFNTFGQVDTKKNHDIEGTGLGLPISKNLVKLMGGVINIDSQYGQGTEFKVVIPQKVIDKKPVITIPNPESIRVLYYFTLNNDSKFVQEAYQKTFKTTNERFGVKNHVCKNLGEVRRELCTNKYTHMFIGRRTYLEDKKYFDELSKIMYLALVQDRIGCITPGEKIHNIYKPFNSLAFGDIMNYVERINDLRDKQLIPIRFTAPDANILIVDDNTMNLKVATGLMKVYKMNIETASSGMEAVELVKSKKYDIIFMDHLMPEMDGVDTLKHIRKLKQEYVSNIPVIALTANAVSGIREKFFDEGFQDFVSKPIQSEVLQMALLRWLPEELIIHKKEYFNE